MNTHITTPHVYRLFWLTLVTAALAASQVHPLLDGLWGDLLLWGGCYAISLTCGWRHSQRPQLAYEILSHCLAVMALLIFLSTLFTQGLDVTLLTFLLWIQAARNVTLRTQRDLFFALVVSFCILLYAAAYSKHSSFVLYMMAYTLAATSTLAVHYGDARQQQAHKVAVSRLHYPAFAVNIVFLSCAIVLSATVVYLSVPRPPAAHLGGMFGSGGQQYHQRSWLEEARNTAGKADATPEPTHTDPAAGAPADSAEPATDTPVSKAAQGQQGTFDYAGFRNRLPLQHESGACLSNAMVMYVQADRPLYLRGAVFDTFAQETWQKSLPGTEKLRLDQGSLSFGPRTQRDLVVHTMTVEQPLPPLLFAAERVKQLQFPGKVIARDAYGALEAPGPLRRGTVYAARSQLLSVAGRSASGVEALRDPNPYLQVPPDLAPQVAELAATLTTNAGTTLERALTLEQHLRSAYTYTLDTIFTSQGRLALDTFLFQTRRGHCEYFATALALMLRTQGIPSRLATGFTATNYNPLTGYYEVRGLNAHAWVEAYIPAHGWVLLEPTPGYNLPSAPPAATGTPAALMSYLDTLTQASQISAPGALGTRLLAAMTAVLRHLQAWLQELGLALRFLGSMLWRIMLACWLYVLSTSLLVSLVVYYGRYRLLAHLASWRLARLSRRHPEALALACYAELERLGARYCVPRHTALTIDEYQIWLLRHYPGLHAPLQTLTESFRVARYRGVTPSSVPPGELLTAFAAISQHLLATAALPSLLDNVRRWSVWWSRWRSS